MERGIRIDLNNGHLENARPSIVLRFDPDSNVNDESDVHDEKQLNPIDATEAGRRIEVNAEQYSKVIGLI
jgi:hypothetical protein